MFIKKILIILLIPILLVSCAPSVIPALYATAVPTERHVHSPLSESTTALVGTWTSTVRKEDLMRVRPELLQEYLCGNAGTFLWTFNADGTWTMDQTLLPDCTKDGYIHIEDTWFMDGSLIIFEKGALDQQIFKIAIDGDQLTFNVESSHCPPCIAIFTANPWTRVE